MELVDQVLRRMGRHATALLPFSLAIGLIFQDLAALARPFVGPLAIVLLMLALTRTDWPRVAALLVRPWLAIALSLANLIVVPLLMQLRKTDYEARVVQWLSAVVLGVGLALFVERVVFGV